MNIYDKLKESLLITIQEHGFDKEIVTINTKVLDPKEAIGDTKKMDYPILQGKEYLINSYFKGTVGQAFTDEPSNFKGYLMDIVTMDMDVSKNRSIFVATLNAVYSHLGVVKDCIHCKNNGPELCAEKIKEFFNGKDLKIGMVGFQPSIIEALSSTHQLRVLDLQYENIGKLKYGVTIEDGRVMMEDVKNWCDVMLVTGSTVCNGTIVDFISGDKKTYFYGTSIAASAQILGLERLCFADDVKSV